ncbi:MAG: ABC transporter ATP-binding protein [Candidatus Cryptobacteroides sp.]
MIEATNICKAFGQLQVLRDVNFHAQEGEILAIVGASGAGKTTLLQILGTLLSPDSGSLTIASQCIFGKGKAPSDKEISAFRNRHLGFVFQAHHLLPEFTALENVMIPALIANEKESRAKEKALQLLDKVGLKDRASHKPGQLSGGEQQRVAIARALVNSPDLLLADEPTGNLDSATKEEIHSLLFDLRKSLGQTIILVTHDPALAALCDRCLEMKDGQILSR